MRVRRGSRAALKSTRECSNRKPLMRQARRGGGLAPSRSRPYRPDIPTYYVVRFKDFRELPEQWEFEASGPDAAILQSSD